MNDLYLEVSFDPFPPFDRNGRNDRNQNYYGLTPAPRNQPSKQLQRDVSGEPLFAVTQLASHFVATIEEFPVVGSNF